MKLGFLTGDSSWGENNTNTEYTPIVGFQLGWIRDHQNETGCPALTGDMGLLTAHCGSCGSDI